MVISLEKKTTLFQVSLQDFLIGEMGAILCKTFFLSDVRDDSFNGEIGIIYTTK